MSLVFIIIGIGLLVVSYLGCVLPVLPGPLLAFFSVLSLYLTDHKPSIAVIIASAAVVLVASVLDYAVPAIGAKLFKCSRAGVVGCFLGTIYAFVIGTVASLFCTVFVGSFVLVLLLVFGPFIGTFLGELYANRSFSGAFRGAVGAVIGYVLAIGMKLFACLIITILFFWTWFGA